MKMLCALMRKQWQGRSGKDEDEDGQIVVAAMPCSVSHEAYADGHYSLQESSFGRQLES